MVICPECREECENNEVIGRILRKMKYCPECGIELQDLDEFESNEKANNEDDAIEARKLEAKNDS